MLKKILTIIQKRDCPLVLSRTKIWAPLAGWLIYKIQKLRPSKFLKSFEPKLIYFYLIYKIKKKAQSGHNWNSLFINQDAVANLMANRYNIDKSEIFDVHGTGKKKSNVAVKLAVGETQIVNDIRKFLVRNGVKLDSFQQNSNNTERSKTVMLIKNLPNKTSEHELREMFKNAKVNGDSVKRLVMPDYGVAALVEFSERQEARDAFKKLAYRKFKSVPVYLEWAPVDVFDGNSNEQNEDEEVVGFV